ncbi:hypothetical protein UlMin_010403 [Ulmus minor]
MNRIISSRASGNPISLFTTQFHSFAANHRSGMNLDFEQHIHKRCKSGNLEVDEALRHFNSMIKMRPLPSVRAFNYLLGTVSKMKHCSTVLCLYREMMACLLLEPDVCTFTIVIKCLCRLKKVDLGFPVLAVLLKHGLQPDAYTLTTSASWLFQYILDKGHPCNVVTYATIINGLCKDGQSLKALELLSQMHETMIDHGVKPDIVTYSSLMHGLCRSGERKEAIKLLNMMKRQAIPPNVFTFSILVDALCKERRTKEALTVLGLMTQGGPSPNVVTYNSLLNGLCHSGQMEEAMRLFDGMVSRDIFPNTKYTFKWFL